MAADVAVILRFPNSNWVQVESVLTAAMYMGVSDDERTVKRESDVMLLFMRGRASKRRIRGSRLTAD